MDKQESIRIFANQYAKLTETDKNEFSRLANRLLSINYICAKRESDPDDYYAIQSRITLYQNYFSVMDYEVLNHSRDQVIQLKNTEKMNHLRLKLNESVFLLVLRKLYARKMQTISLTDNISVLVSEVHEAMIEVGAQDKRIKKTEFVEMIRLFKRFGLIDNIGEMDKDDTILLLYPSLLYAIPYEQIDEIDKRIKSYSREDEEDETAEEDSAD